MGRKQKHIKVSWKYVEIPDGELRFEQAFDILFEFTLKEWVRKRQEHPKKEQAE